MTAEFLDSSARIVDAILDTGDQPKRFTLTSALYRHIDFPDGRPGEVYQATEVPERLYGCALLVEPGAHHAWSIRTEAGKLWNERGPVSYLGPE